MIPKMVFNLVDGITLSSESIKNTHMVSISLIKRKYNTRIVSSV